MGRWLSHYGAGVHETDIDDDNNDYLMMSFLETATTMWMMMVVFVGVVVDGWVGGCVGVLVMMMICNVII